MINKETYIEMKKLVEEYETNLENPIEKDMTQEPYILDIKIDVERKYNPEYDPNDDKECECGHAYYRHFDSYENMEPIGCKYCHCFHFTEKYPKKKIYGMIHLSSVQGDGLNRAIDEIKIYEDEGLYGFIIENYHGSIDDVIDVLEHLKEHPSTIKVGINILPNEYEVVLDLCVKYPFISFIQLDYVSGEYVNAKVISPDDIGDEIISRGLHQLEVLGGVWPKYYNPIEGSNLKNDVKNSLCLVTGLVVTGDATGKETPLFKIKNFKDIMDNNYYGRNKNLIVGAGLTPLNVREQLEIADGAIVGSAFKPNGRTHQMVDRDLVRVFMEEVNKIKL